MARRRTFVVTAVLALLSTASAEAAAPMDARAFVDTQGVNTHLWYTNTVYNNYAMVKAKLQELGLRHVRDGFDPSRRQLFYDRVNGLSAGGIRSTLISCRLNGTGGWIGVDEEVSAAKNKIRSALDGIEGTNEPDIQGIANWVADTRGCQDRLYKLAKDVNYGPALSVPILEPSVTGDRYDELGTMLTGMFGGRRADGRNIHPYPGNEKPSGPTHYPFTRAMSESRQFGFGGAGVRVDATETGYHNALGYTGGHRPVSERASGIYLPRLFMEYAKAGVTRTFIYELVNLWPTSSTNEQSNFGLYRNDWTPKPAATAIRNMNRLLDSPTAGVLTALAYTVNTPGIKHLLMRKADSSYWLALWRDTSVWNGSADVSNAAVSVSVSLPRPMGVAVYEPNQGTASLGSASGRSSFTTNVADNVRLVKLTG